MKCEKSDEKNVTIIKDELKEQISEDQQNEHDEEDWLSHIW